MILARYLLKQFFPPFLFGLALFSGVLLLDRVFDLVDLLVNKGVSLGVSARMFLLFLPTVLTLTIPMSMLLACLLTFGRLSEDNEITALRASGLSFGQMLWPPLVIALLLSAAMAPFNAVLAPRAMNAFRSLYHAIITADPLVKIEPRRFITLQNVRLYARETDPAQAALKDVTLYNISSDRWQRIYARRGVAQVDARSLVLRLEQGQLEQFSWENPLDVLHLKFKDYTLAVPFGGEAGGRDRSWRELSVAQLREEIRRRKADGLSPGPVSAEMHLRFAIAASPLALALLGIPLGIALEKGGRGVGFGASIGVLFLYYLLLIFGLNLAEKDALPALPALWLPNLFMGAVGLILYHRRLRQ